MFISLSNRSLLKVSGKDAESFLQSQFSNDIKNIQDRKVQINAYCQHQGKVITVLWVLKQDSDYYLSIPNELKELTLSKLQMYKLMSQVDIEDFSEMVYQYGLIEEVNVESFKINEKLSILITSELFKDSQDISHWEILCINENLPEIYLKMSEKFIPQSLNLDINQIGVSFTKGCYPGQEVVARMYYLGKPKRRLFRFTSQFEVCVGDNLNVKDSKSLKSSGQVIRVAKNDTEFQFLGVFEVGHINDNIFLNNDLTKLVYLIHG